MTIPAKALADGGGHAIGRTLIGGGAIVGAAIIGVGSALGIDCHDIVDARR